jgi:hypothetical protein
MAAFILYSPLFLKKYNEVINAKGSRMKVIYIEDLKADDRLLRTASLRFDPVAVVERKRIQERPVTPDDVPLAPRFNRMKLLIASISCFLVASALFVWLMESSIEKWLAAATK